MTFIDVTVWDRQAETCCQYLKKGRAVHVEGFLKMDTWDDKTTGEKRSKLKVQADRVQFLDRKDDAGGGSARWARTTSTPPPPREAPGPRAQWRGMGNGPARGGYQRPGPGRSATAPGAAGRRAGRRRHPVLT